MSGGARVALLALLAFLLALPACGDDDGGGGEGGAGDGGTLAQTDATTAPTATEDDEPLTAVEVDVSVPSLGGGARRFDLFCNPPSGTHPRPKRACEVLIENADALEPVPKGTACTQQFGGQKRAAVHGTVNGKEVTASFNRRNGCEIARWDRLAPLLNVE